MTKAKSIFKKSIMYLLVFCMTVCSMILIMPANTFNASAQTYTLTSFPSSFTAGNTYNITLGADVTRDSKLPTIPANCTVNLNFNNHKVLFKHLHDGPTDSFDICTENYTSHNNTYMGFITNNGTLNMTGSGTFKLLAADYNGKLNNNKSKDNLMAKGAAIVNNGTLTVGAGVTVESDMTVTITKDGTNAFQKSELADLFVYSFAIRNTGTVNTSGTIKCGVLAMSQAGGEGNSYHMATGYGIYGGTVNVLGGNIITEALSGAGNSTSGCKEANLMWEMAVGICSNNVTVSGVANINTKTTNWMSTKDNDCWKNGFGYQFSVGILYEGVNYPKVGPGCNITSSWQGANGVNINIPGTQDEGLDLHYNVKMADPCKDLQRLGVPVAGVSSLEPAARAEQTQEVSDVKAWFGSTAGKIGNIPTSYKYYPYNAYSANYTGSTYAFDLTTYSDYRKYQETSGKDTTENIAYFTNGAPSQTGGQYVIMYRYYDNSVQAGNLKAVNMRYNNNGAGAYANVNYQGYIKSGNGQDALCGATYDASTNYLYKSGGASKNTAFYDWSSVTYETPAVADFCRRNLSMITNWNATGSGMYQLSSGTNNSASIGSGKVLVIYFNYVKKDPSSIRVAVSAKGNIITKDSTGSSVTVDYTGKAVVPGTDFNLGIIDMGADTDIIVNNNGNTGDDTVVTNAQSGVSRGYNITGTGSGINVSYKYSTDGGKTYPNDGLPKDSGTYKIQAIVDSDVDIRISGAMNRLGGTFTFDLTINRAKVTLGGFPSNLTYRGTYGQRYVDIIDLASLTATGVNGEIPLGTFNISSVDGNLYPNATDNFAVTVTWTPGTSAEKNYDLVSQDVTIIVAKRNVTVNASDLTIKYGDPDLSKAKITFENLAECDSVKSDNWVNGSQFEINYNSEWQSYAVLAGNGYLPVGTYAMRIASFGGSADTNNTFTLNTSNAKLTVEPKVISYTAVAADREYNGTTLVDVTLTYASGLVGADEITVTSAVKGNTDDANVGSSKNVTVDDATITLAGARASSYKAVIANKDSLTVNITKSTPVIKTTVSTPDKLTYNSAAKLVDSAVPSGSAVASFDGTLGIEGTWSWKIPASVPTVKQGTYKAVFTPNDAVNYNTVEADVAIAVAKKEITVTVPELSAKYGDPIPAITSQITMTGWTGTDSFDNVATTGQASATTTYIQGAPTGTYPIDIEGTYASDNYSFKYVDSTLVIGKRSLTVTVANDTITYGDAVPVYTVDNLTFEGFYGDDDYTVLSPAPSINANGYYVGANAGTYEIQCNAGTSSNYDITVNNGTLTVDKAVLTVTPDDQVIPYGSPVPAFTSTYTGFVAGDSITTTVIQGTTTYSTTYAQNRPVNEYTSTAVVGDLSAVNYTFAGASGKVTVIKATPSVTVAPTAKIVFGQSLASAVFSGDTVLNPNNGNNVAGSFAYQQTTLVPAYAQSGSSFTARFTPADSDNYNAVNVTVVLTIDEKEISGIPVISGSPMAGQVLTASLDSMTPEDLAVYDIQWFRGNAAVQGANGVTYNVTNADIGSTIKVVVTAKANSGYTGEASSIETTVVIQSLTPVTSAQLDIDVPTNCDYDNQYHYANVSVKSQYAGYVGSVTVYYNGKIEAPKDAGTYTVTVDIGTPALRPGETAYTSDYYGPVSGLEIGEFTINKIDYTVTYTPASKVYDGTVTASATVNEAGALDGTVVSLAPGYYFQFADKNAGTKAVNTYGMALTGADSANYNLVVVPANGTITPAKLSVKANASTRAYNGDTTVDILFSNISGYVNGEDAVDIYLTNGKGTMSTPNAGTNTVSNITYDKNGISKDNYEVVISNLDEVTAVISKAVPVVTAPTITGLEYNSTRTLAQIDLSAYSDANGSFVFTDTTVVPTCDVTDYSGRYISKNSNYSNLDVTINVIVAKKMVVLTADNATVVYGKEAPSFTLTADGFTGTDNLDDPNVAGGFHTITTNYAPGSAIGTYDIIINNSHNSANYTFTTVKGILRVTPAVLKVTAAAEDRQYDSTKNVNVNFTIESGKYGSDNVGLSYYTTVGIAASANAGTQIVTYTAPTLTGTKSSNYVLSVTPMSGNLTVVIDKADPMGVVFPDSAYIDFGNPLSNAQFTTTGSGAGKFAYVNGSDVPSAVGTFANYIVRFTPTDPNYKTVEKAVTLTVNVAKIDFVVGISGTLYSGNPLTAVLTGAPTLSTSYMKYQWYRVTESGAESIPGATGSVYKTTDEDIGAKIIVIVYFDASSPFQLKDDANVQSVINDGISGILAQTTENISEKFMTFWERLLAWWYKIIAAIQSLIFGIGGKK